VGLVYAIVDKRQHYFNQITSLYFSIVRMRDVQNITSRYFQ